ncbi:MAG: hypothetical protein IPK82_06985 [Polyangiaceae bacterium]|nr:hypothetical protein [Polyangiaceae bacterium]
MSDSIASEIRAHFAHQNNEPLRENQIFLVGSNPLPVAIVALALQPQTAYLVYTPEVRLRVERLAALLRQSKSKVHFIELRSAQDAHKIRQDLDGYRQLFSVAGLFYTGGTKVMSVQVHAFWRGCQVDGAMQHACSLGSDGVLRFDNGNVVVPLTTAPKFTLEQLCQLHTGLLFKTSHRFDLSTNQSNPAPDPPEVALANDIVAHICAIDAEKAQEAKQRMALYQSGLPPMYGQAKCTLGLPVGHQVEKPPEVRCTYQAADEANFGESAAFTRWPIRTAPELSVVPTHLDELAQKLFQKAIPQSGSERRKLRKKTAQWLWSEWLELWLAGFLAKLTEWDDRSPMFHEVFQNVELKKDSDSFFEADVVAVRGPTAHLFSCTVDTTKSLVKGKLFEAVQRASQMGGDHARVAVFSLMDAPENVSKTIQDEGWEGYDTARVFGMVHLLDHVRFTEELRTWILGRNR